MNLFFAGTLKAMPARLVSDNGRHVVIRPLVLVSEDEARAYAQECGLPIVGCCCSACGDLGLQRQRVKRLHLRSRARAPRREGVDAAARWRNVTPRHLLDCAAQPRRRTRGAARCSTRRVTPRGSIRR
ncbi:MAG: hypothetical protein MZV64_73495 [Ignavibacteriales bacterium]|nr:hypothetical protein [Ignavibacteriales bacterium]